MKDFYEFIHRHFFWAWVVTYLMFMGSYLLGSGAFSKGIDRLVKKRPHK